MENTTRGSNGKVGQSSAGDRVKARFTKENSKLSLKDFVRTLVKLGEKDAKDWMDNKSGLGEVSRSEKNKTRVHLEKAMTKASKSKKK